MGTVEQTIQTTTAKKTIVVQENQQPEALQRQRDLQRQRELGLQQQRQWDQNGNEIAPQPVQQPSEQLMRESTEEEIRVQVKKLGESLKILMRQDSDYGILSKDKTGTDSFAILQRAAQRVIRFSDKAREDISPAEAMSAILLLSEAANGYYDLHRGFRFTSVGDDRKNAAKYIQSKMIPLFDMLDQKAGGKGMKLTHDRETAQSVTVRQTDASKAKVKELAAHYRKWAQHFAKREGFEREAIQEKVNLMKPYMRDIEIYKSAYPDMKQWPSDVAEIIKVYHEYKMKHHLLHFLEKSEDMKKKLTDPLLLMTQEQADEYGERGKEKKFSRKVMDAALSEEQLRAVDAIDQWFVRNHNNAGFLGSVVGVRNHHEEIISALFKKTKRERLFIYYLIQTGKRKDPSAMDVFESQEGYVPNLAAFRNQMEASKLKIIGHATGSYIYMHKLAEAMQINLTYRDLLKDVAELQNQQLGDERKVEKERPAEQEENQQNTEAQRELETALHDRTAIIGELYGILKEMSQEEKERLKTGKKKDRIYDDTLVNAAEQKRKDLLQADEWVGKLEQKQRKVMNKKVSELADVTQYAGYLTSSEKAAESAGKTAELFWNLKETPFGAVNFLGANLGGTAVLATSELLSLTAGLFSLAKGHANMHKGDIAAGLFGMLKSAGNIVKSGWTAVDAVKQVGLLKGALDVAAYSKPVTLQTFGIITAGAAVGLSAYKAASGGLDVVNAIRANHYFNKKQKLKNPKKDPLKSRELRYEKNMTKLATQVSVTKAAFGVVDTAVSGLALGAFFVPGIGQVVVAGISAVAAIGSSIAKVISGNLIRKSMFDTYFNIDDLYKRALARMKEEGRPVQDTDAFKTQLRRRVAAAAGFSGVGAAADQIALRYAMYVYDRLHGENKLGPGEERNAYIQLVKAFGLSYSEKKKRPAAGALAKKMSGR